MEFKKSTSLAPNTSFETLIRIGTIFIEAMKHIFYYLLLLAAANRIIVYILMPSAIGMWSVPESQIDIKSMSLLSQLSLTIPSILQYPIFMILIAYTYNIIFNNSKELKSISVKMLKRAHIIIITALIYCLMIGIGCVLLIIPGLYVIGAFSMALPSIAIDNKGIISSLKFSKNLTKGSVFYAILVILLSMVVPNVIFTLIGSYISEIISNIYFNEILILLTSTISTCITICAFTFLYNELTIRRTEQDLISSKMEEIEEN